MGSSPYKYSMWTTFKGVQNSKSKTLQNKSVRNTILSRHTSVCATKLGCEHYYIRLCTPQYYLCKYIVTILADQCIYDIEARENLATSFRVIRAAVPSLGWVRDEM